MPRQKISEYRAKTILCEALGQPYVGWSIDTSASDYVASLRGLPADQHYVIKVDEGVKGRFKKGLVLLDRTPAQLVADAQTLAAKGYRYLLVEPFQPHAAQSEYYLAIERTRAANMVMFSKLGGVNVEANAATMKREPLAPTSAAHISRELGLPAAALEALAAAFDRDHFSFLEINPLVVTPGGLQLLDAAVEVDDQAAPLVAGGRWTMADLRSHGVKAPEELEVEELAGRSQASFRLKILNPGGSVFLLLSGGGASVVVADEVTARGFGPQLANYGEYSGNPSEEETYLYTRQIIALMLKSKAEHKVLIISGAVANFTDIRVTFRGIIKALDEAKKALQQDHVKVFVRRGGPFEAEGLAAISVFLREAGLYGLVAGPDLGLADIVPPALASLGAAAEVAA